MSFSVETFNFGKLPDNFEFNQVPEWFPSICIPRAFSNLDRRIISNVFIDLFGRDAIERVDVVAKENDRGEKFNRVFVHFNHWPHTRQSSAVRRRLLEGETVNVVYDQPWFWKCSASRVSRPQPVSRDNSRPYVILRPGDVILRRGESKSETESKPRVSAAKIDEEKADTKEESAEPKAQSDPEKPKKKFQFVPRSVTSTTRKPVQKK